MLTTCQNNIIQSDSLIHSIKPNYFPVQLLSDYEEAGWISVLLNLGFL